VLVVTALQTFDHRRLLIDREQFVSLTNRTYMRHVSPVGDLGSHLKSHRANEPSLEPETISSAKKINYLNQSLQPAFANYVQIKSN
jgi:hypothetical protein